MFQSLARLVNHRGWVIILGWVVVTAGLVWVAPAWESVTKDDDVSFFPAGYPSVIGQALSKRGFPWRRGKLTVCPGHRAVEWETDPTRL